MHIYVIISLAAFFSSFFSATRRLILSPLKAYCFHEWHPSNLSPFVLLEHVRLNTSVVSAVLTLQMHNVENVLPEVVITPDMSLETI